MKFDIGDVLAVLGLVVLIIGLALTHPALIVALVGYVAFSHGVNRSR